MNAEEWLSILSLLISLGTAAAIFIAKNWITARITKSVQHQFDVKIEGVRAELRNNEESFKSKIRDKEAENSLLRSTVLTGSASRQSLMDKRQFEAVERVWTTVNDMAQYKPLAGMMAVLNFKAIAKQTADPKIQQFINFIDKVAPDVKQLKNVGRDERPFLPELAWAYFSAYTIILTSSYLRLQVLKSGMQDADKMITNEPTQKILKAALPHQSKFIEENEPETYYFLLDELEGSLLLELRNILEGKHADQAATEKAKKIMDAIKNADVEQARHITSSAEEVG